MVRWRGYYHVATPRSKRGWTNGSIWPKLTATMIESPAAGCVEEGPMKPASIAAQGLGWVDDHTRALAPPIHTSTTFIRDPDNQYRAGHAYSRDQNPTFDQAEAVLTALEGGHASLLFSSGIGVAPALFPGIRQGYNGSRPRW